MTTHIHPSAIVEDGAVIGENTRIGPYCVIGSDVRLGYGVVLESHVVIQGQTTIGDRSHIYPFACVGHAPQDLKYHGESSSVVVGSHTVVREHVTIHPGTEGGGLVTEIGDHCLLMVGSHVAHDCQLGHHVILANNATLAGHVTVGDHAIIGGLSAIHQFVRIGQHAIVGGMSGVEHDVIPYGSAMGERAHLQGLNLVGLKRRGFDRDAIHRLRHSYKSLFESSSHSFQERVQALAKEAANDAEVLDIIRFLQADSSRSILQPPLPSTTTDAVSA